MTPTEKTIHDFVESSLLDNGHELAGPVGRDQDLLAALDSLQILRMLLDLEAQYGIKIDNSELTPENLGTIRRLAELITRKQQAVVF